MKNLTIEHQGKSLKYSYDEKLEDDLKALGVDVEKELEEILKREMEIAWDRIKDGK